jgi:beta-1,2-mannobiose phosphorylase / 1,2-beta-oligomannan phosphorylase
MSGLMLRRLGIVMEPEPGNPQEIEGVLNPAAVRGPDGHLYLFPRLVAAGNYSRIGIARVTFNQAGDPAGVERLGIALEPEAEYELRPGGGGCEDPRITFVEPLQRYVMTYTANSHDGPRIALAISDDVFHWERLGLATFATYRGIDFVHVDNKDASLFPVAIPNHAGKPQMGLLHRPLFPGTRPEEKAGQGAIGKNAPRALDLPHESIWISYCPMPSARHLPTRLDVFNSHHRLAVPVAPWERLKIGGGTPPILTRHGWLILYHGVEQLAQTDTDGRHLSYSAGMMVLAKEHPREIRYRSPQPVLSPVLSQERSGTIANVVFPTGIDRRDDLGASDRFDIYFGMADDRIGVARLDLPAVLPPGGAADPKETTISPRFGVFGRLIRSMLRTPDRGA